MKKLIQFSILLSLLFSQLCMADAYERDRREMKVLLEAIVDDLNDGAIENFDKYLVADAVVTFYDGRHAVGAEAVKSYMQKMLTGDNPVLKSITTTAEEDTEAKIYPNDFATAHGWLKNELVFVGGKKMQVDGRWTTSLIKQDKQWKVATLHFSTNIFDNAVLNEAKSSLWMFTTLSFVIGLILGWLFKRTKKRN